MILSIVVAASDNNMIGKNNQLLWHLPNDLKFFKNTTWASPVVMGRKTFESLGNKALNGRVNIVITRQKDFIADGVTVVHSLDEATQLAQQLSYKELFVLGGGQIYQEAIAKADKIYITRVHAILEGDTQFPFIDEMKWQLAFHESHVKDAKHAFDYDFQLWKRK